MRRTPGTPVEKLALLGGLDETSLPHLVADVLYFCRNHRNVVIVDGPGDGRRDISSTRPDGAKHVVSRIFASWNQLDGWLRQLERLRRTA